MGGNHTPLIMGFDIPRANHRLGFANTRGGGAMRAWEVAKGILIAAAILTAVGWLMSAAMCAGGAAVFSEVMEQASEKSERAAVLHKANQVKREQLTRQQRLNAPKGKSLNRQCQDWKKAQADYDLPSTREGVARYCGELERYLAGAF